MTPRHVATVGVAVVAVLVSGCLGGSGGATDLGVTAIDGDWTEDGAIEVRVTVFNAGSAEATGTVLVWVAVDGVDTYTERREVAVPASSTETVVVEFEPPADAVGSGFDAGGRVE